MIDHRFPAACAWLEAHRAGAMDHPGGTLLEHLRRVAARLDADTTRHWLPQPARSDLPLLLGADR